MTVPLTDAERSRFEALAPYAGSAALGTDDAAWLAECAARHPALAAELAQHRALREGLQARFAAVPEDIGMARAKAQIRAERGARPAAPPSLVDRLRAWLTPVPAWALACSLLALPLAFLVGRETAPPPYAEMRSARPGLFDGPLLRINFQPQTPEHAVRELAQAQGALLVGPTRLGDWYAKVAPARVEAVRAALAQQGAVASVEVVMALPPELLEP
jgi:hypothetical protein